MAKVIYKGKGTYLIITPDKKEVTINYVNAIFKFQNRFAIFRKIDSVTGKKQYGYFNEYGEDITKRLYDYAENFEGDYAKVGKWGKQNFIDKSGKEILKWKYRSAEKFIGNTFFVSLLTRPGERKQLWGLVDKNDNILIDLVYSSKLEVISKAKDLFPDLIPLINEKHSQSESENERPPNEN